MNETARIRRDHLQALYYKLPFVATAAACVEKGLFLYLADNIQYSSRMPMGERRNVYAAQIRSSIRVLVVSGAIDPLVLYLLCDAETVVVVLTDSCDAVGSRPLSVRRLLRLLQLPPFPRRRRARVFLAVCVLPNAFFVCAQHYVLGDGGRRTYTERRSDLVDDRTVAAAAAQPCSCSPVGKSSASRSSSSTAVAAARRLRSCGAIDLQKTHSSPALSSSAQCVAAVACAVVGAAPRALLLIAIRVRSTACLVARDRRSSAACGPNPTHYHHLIIVVVPESHSSLMPAHETSAEHFSTQYGDRADRSVPFRFDSIELLGAVPLTDAIFVGCSPKYA
jgi:hypothetical protein